MVGWGIAGLATNTRAHTVTRTHAQKHTQKRTHAETHTTQTHTRGDVCRGAGELNVQLNAALVVSLEVDIWLGLIQPDAEPCPRCVAKAHSVHTLFDTHTHTRIWLSLPTLHEGRQKIVSPTAVGVCICVHRIGLGAIGSKRSSKRSSAVARELLGLGRSKGSGEGG